MTHEGFVRVSWQPEPDGSGELSLEAVSSTGFAGRGSAWFNDSALRDFAQRIAGYPLSSDPIELRSGHQGLNGELDVHVGLAVYQVGTKGQLGIGVQLARTPWQAPEMRGREQHRVWLEVLTTYQRLGEFSVAIEHVLDGDIDSAEIGGESLA